jgi:hypothetical protein
MWQIATGLLLLLVAVPLVVSRLATYTSAEGAGRADPPAAPEARR